MSRFVAAGSASSYTPPTTTTPAADEWSLAHQDLEASRQRKEEQSRSQQQSGSSLYETLQANKAAKQEAFEEASKLKHQFRALDDDEISFLDSVLESERAKEAEVKKEEAERLAVFKKAREEAEKGGALEEGDGALEGGEEELLWTAGGAGRKRKKGKEGAALKGVKVRRTSSAAAQVDCLKSAEKKEEVAVNTTALKADTPASSKPTPSSNASIPAQTTVSSRPASASSPTPASAALGLGLGGYSSDED